MFGAFIRAAPTVAVGVLVGSILSWILSEMAHLMGPDGSLVRTSFAAVGDNAILVIVLSVIVALLARANAEAKLGV